MTSPELPRGISPETKEALLEASPDELRSRMGEDPGLDAVITAILEGDGRISRLLNDDRAPRRRPRWIAPVGLLAAAGLAAFLGRGLLPAPDGSPGIPGPGAAVPTTPLPAPAAVATNARPLDLEVETTSDFAVFPTDDPDIAVVWLLNGDDR